MKRPVVIGICLTVAAGAAAFLLVKPVATIDVLALDEAYPRAVSWSGEYLALRGKNNLLVAYSKQFGSVNVPMSASYEDPIWSCVTNKGKFYGFARMAKTRSQYVSFAWSLKEGLKLGDSLETPKGFAPIAVDEKGERFLGGPVGEWSRPSVYQQGRALQAVPVPASVKSVFAGQMSADGSVMIGIVDIATTRKPAIWVNGELNVFDLPDGPAGLQMNYTGFFAAVDATGHAAIITTPTRQRSYLWRDGKLTKIYDFTPPPVTPPKPSASKNGITMAKFPPMDYVDFDCVTHAGSRIYGTHHTGDHGEIETAVVWTESEGVVDLSEWLQRHYRIQLPSVKLSGIRRATPDGRTLVGYGRQGMSLQTFVMRLPD